MYVRPVARGAGVGDAIVAALLDEANRIGVRSVLLTVIAGNERAERLYRRWGFAGDWETTSATSSRAVVPVAG